MNTSINTQPILFLDIDGPLVTNDSGGVAQTRPDTVVLKPEAVHFVNELVRIAGAQIVLISSWASNCMHLENNSISEWDLTSAPQNLLKAFQRNGLVHDRFQPVWSHICIKSQPGIKMQHLHCPDAVFRGYRPTYWLKTQGMRRHYAILDDAPCFHEDILYFHREEDPVLWGRGYRQIDPNTGIAHPDFDPGYVQIDANKGITRTDFDRALHLLIEGIGQ
jgi:hypothetical protein